MSSDDLRGAPFSGSEEMDRNLPAVVGAQFHAGAAGPQRYEPATTIALAALKSLPGGCGWNSAAIE
jgi:hypothetical protein